MHQTYKVLSFAIVAALYIFLVPSTSHAQTHVPNTLAGAPVCAGKGYPGTKWKGWTNGCDRIPLNGQPATAQVCERLANTRFVPATWKNGNAYSEDRKATYELIQATGGYCYYYKDGTSSGRGGPNMWSYGTPLPSVAECSVFNSKYQMYVRRGPTDYRDKVGLACQFVKTPPGGWGK